MSRRTIVAVALAAAGLAACESTQEKAAKVQAEGINSLSQRKGLEITTANADVKVLGKTVLHDKNGTAVVVELKNEGTKDQVRVPIAIELTDAKGKRFFANDIPGLEPALVSVPLLPKGEKSFWIHNQIIGTGVPKSLEVEVGAAKPVDVPAEPPHITLSKVRLDEDESGALAAGIVHNKSDVLQKRLTIYCIAKKDGRIVAAGRAVVDKLPPSPHKKPITFTVYFIGDPKGATLDFSAPPVSLR